MIASLWRRGGQLRTDAVLRHWLVDLATSSNKRPPAFTPGNPPYLAALPTATGRSVADASAHNSLCADRPTGPITLGLPDYADTGAQIMLAEAGRIFAPSGVLREGSSH